MKGIKMILREAVARVLFNKSLKELLNEEIEICNRFIDNYNKVKELV